MQRDIVAAILIALFAAFVALAVRSVRKRTVAASGLVLNDVSALTGDEIAEAAGLYVSTVETSKPLERITAKGLMHRGQARLSVLSDGLIIDRTGESSIAITAADMCEVSRASATIDKGVERDGLLAISWMAGDICLTTNLRLAREDDTKELFETLVSMTNKEAHA
jgi:hypothetical protein